MESLPFRSFSIAVLFKRALPRETVARSISILLAAMIFIVFSLIALLLLEERGFTAALGDEVFLRSLFDLVSAFGTVGLSTGVVSHLSVAARPSSSSPCSPGDWVP